jgi:protein-disulfide isomerase
MSDLRSAVIPALGDDDHVRGQVGAPLLIEYGDFECPYCAVLHVRLQELATRAEFQLAFRHFPVRSAHPRSMAAACASEAAAGQGRFWEMHDSLLADQSHLEDPHLWERAQSLGLDLERFERDRRSDPVIARVTRDFTAAVRGGVVTTPTVIHEGTSHTGDGIQQLLDEMAS